MVLMAECPLSLLMVGISCLLSANTAFQMDYEQKANFQCPDNQHISRVKGDHSRDYQDRMWEFECSSLQGAQFSSCTWDTHVNKEDKTLDFRCPSERVITGVASSFNPSYHDRRFSYLCCDLVGKSLDRCQVTAYVNQYNQDKDYTALDGKVIVGFKSVNSNSYQDRRWKVKICSVK